jgi:lipoprotein-releasing system ATP-binding protein
MPLLELNGVTKTYGPVGSGREIRVLDGLDLTLNAGQSLAVVGPSGCGKSTLLNLVGGLDRPSSGSIRLDGTDLAHRSEPELADLRNRRIGFVFQQHHLLPQCTLLENVLLPTLPRRLSAAGRRDAARRAVALLDRVGLADRRDHRPGQLSGGEAQRAAVVRALINDPALLLADEPTGALDEASAEMLGALLASLNRTAGVTLILVTHSVPLARRMASVRPLEHGRLQPPAATARD